MCVSVSLCVSLRARAYFTCITSVCVCACDRERDMLHMQSMWHIKASCITHIDIHTLTDTYTDTHAHTYTHTHTHTQTHTSQTYTVQNICLYVCLCVIVCMCKYVHERMCVFMWMCLWCQCQGWTKYYLITILMKHHDTVNTILSSVLLLL